MTYDEFKKSIDSLREFMEDQKALDDVIKVISPTSTGVVEFGNKFIDDYIRVIEIALGDEYNSVSWFVFENDFGEKGYTITVEGKEFTIRNEKDFFEVQKKIK